MFVSCDWPVSPSPMYSGCLCCSILRISFFVEAKKYSFVFVYHIFFVHSTADGSLGCFYTLVAGDNVVVDVGSRPTLLGVE